MGKVINKGLFSVYIFVLFCFCFRFNAYNCTKMEMHAMEILQLWGLTPEKNAATSSKKKLCDFFLFVQFLHQKLSVLLFVFFDCLFPFSLVYVHHCVYVLFSSILAEALVLYSLPS